MLGCEGRKGRCGKRYERRLRKCVAFCHVTMKPNGQKNDARCEYTRGAPEPLLLQISINT